VVVDGPHDDVDYEGLGGGPGGYGGGGGP
jgi:hypothetical protein